MMGLCAGCRERTKVESDRQLRTTSSPGAASLSRFREKARAHQEFRTRRGKLSGALLPIGIGAAGILVLLLFPAAMAFFPILGWGGYIAARLLPDYAPRIVGMVYLVELIIFGLSIVIGGYLMISASISQLKKVTCPRCATSIEVFSAATTFTCLICNLLMRLTRGTNPTVALVACDYCGLETGATLDCESFACSNCGVPRTGRSTTIYPHAPCPSCGQTRPVAALVCEACGALTLPYHYTNSTVSYLVADLLTSHDMDWLAGKDAKGHRQFASTLLDTVEKTSSAAEGIESLSDAWVALEVAMESIEEGVQNLHDAETVALIRKLESVYCTLLTSEVARIEEQPTKLYEKKDVKALAVSSHVEARRRLEMQFADFLPINAKWSDDCSIDFEDTATGKYKVKDYSRLRAELARVTSAMVRTV
jgi:hypothetical protein